MKFVVEHTEYDGSGGVRIHLLVDDIGDAHAQGLVALAEKAQDAARDGKLTLNELAGLGLDAYALLR